MTASGGSPLRQVWLWVRPEEEATWLEGCRSEAIARRLGGTEYGYIIRGRLRVSIGFDNYELGPGDTISFDCTQPHRFATIGDETVEAVWFVVGRRNTLSIDDASVGP